MSTTFAISTESLEVLLTAQKTLNIKTARAAPGDPQHTCKWAHTGEAFAQILHVPAMIGQT